MIEIGMGMRNSGTREECKQKCSQSNYMHGWYPNRHPVIAARYCFFC